MELSEQAVLRTVIYADIFNFPLTRLEIWSGLLTSKKLTEKIVNTAINSLLNKKILFSDGGYVSLHKDKKYFLHRTGSGKTLVKKQKIAARAGLILAKIPSVDLVGISGGVAVGNADSEDDIDFFIVSAKKYLWTTRLLSILNLKRHGLLRLRKDSRVADKICLNMFVAESSLKIPTEKRDVYTAHEVAQLVPIFSRSDTYQKFREENSWVFKYLPNFSMKKPLYTEPELSGPELGFIYSTPMIQLAKYLQKIYMQTHKTTETVTDEVFAFHPRDYHKYVLAEYNKRLKRFNLKEI